MILYRKEPYPLQMKNIILLDSKDGGVVYVNKSTYDQALLMHSRFDGDLQRVLSALKCKTNEGYVVIVELKELVNNMYNTMPEPLNILAPFLIFCTANQGIEWDRHNYEMGYGILHQMSLATDFNAMTLIPAEARANISLPTVILMQYKRTWDDLCTGLTDYVVTGMQQVTAPQPTQVVVEKAPVNTEHDKPEMSSSSSASDYAAKNASTDSDDEDDGDSIDEDAFAKLQARLAAIAAADPVETTPEPPKPEKPAETPKPSVTSTPASVQEKTETASSVLDEFNF